MLYQISKLIRRATKYIDLIAKQIELYFWHKQTLKNFEKIKEKKCKDFLA